MHCQQIMFIIYYVLLSFVKTFLATYKNMVINEDF